MHFMTRRMKDDRHSVSFESPPEAHLLVQLLNTFHWSLMNQQERQERERGAIKYSFVLYFQTLGVQNQIQSKHLLEAPWSR